MNLFHSCSKIYDPEIKSDDPNLVIEGFLTNIKGESYVKISKSSPFDSNELFTNIPDALVQVIDNSGKVFNFYYSNKNIYYNNELC
jgi:hypothetical protein